MNACLGSFVVASEGTATQRGTACLTLPVLFRACSLQRLFEVAVVLTFTLGQMAQAISVLYELYRLGWFYWLRLRRRKQDNWAGVEDATVITVRYFKMEAECSICGHSHFFGFALDVHLENVR